jgi:hypothetical protein
MRRGDLNRKNRHCEEHRGTCLERSVVDAILAEVILEGV